MSSIHSDAIRMSFKSSYPTWNKNEVMMSYFASGNCFNFQNKTQTQKQIKLWRRLAMEGKIKIANYNNKTKIINGVEHYILVVQPYKDGQFTYTCFDPMGLFILGEMVNGFIYLFKSKENRNKIVEYVMKGVEQPQPIEDNNSEDIVSLFGKKVEEGDELENIIVCNL